ncbi:NAD-dependent succinate-semialdehyde dehydrogenase [Lewinella sp. W8]|uniref:NAD-dependent succinate-semialdehyde dehydrogenase n=1 Tax=Lewinella sp. W8 TaxID=2528208 RepID=UPI0010674CC0|nr:NAD-dependent succinate-semialdehyde dehydrogenase [Lewinella sp. W8]MTB50321.1 succinate-semialdehyde dehydrogenase [Lewinella sp. W8]
MQLSDPTLLRSSAYVNGDWHPAGASFPVLNPFNGELLAEVADATAADTEAAVTAASAAFPEWSARTAAERSKILRRWNDLILENLEDLAQLLTAEQGKPINEAQGEVRYGASFIEWFAEEGKRAYGDVIPGHGRDKRITVVKQPVGVVAAITPWNFPIAMITRKVAPALAVGCTVVVKPAEDTPLSALALAELASRAGFPPGVFNVLPTSNPKAVGAVLTGDERVKKLSFTGSTAVGKQLMADCAGTVKKVSLELGGNAPFIVFDDADLAAAVEGAMASKYRNAGQTCVCANRIFVQNGIYEDFIAAFTRATQALTVGDGSQEATEIGPLINEAALEKVQRLLVEAERNGAEILTGGGPVEGQELLFQPTVVGGASTDMQMSKEEIFGPVAAVYRFETEAEAVELANATPFGLAAYFYGRDYARCWRVAERLEYGMVGINTGMISTAVAPFGGVKESGFGREGSKYGLEDYLMTKYLCWGGVE